MDQMNIFCRPDRMLETARKTAAEMNLRVCLTQMRTHLDDLCICLVRPGCSLAVHGPEVVVIGDELCLELDQRSL
jgi:hypothetical protein